jgi:hypothetical protein
VIGHETQELGRGGGSARVRWPHEGGETERAALRVHLDRDFTQEIAADGAWGLRVVTPTKLSGEERELFLKLAEWEKKRAKGVFERAKDMFS